MKKNIILLALTLASTSAFASEETFNINDVTLLELSKPLPLKSEGGIEAFVASGAWTDVVTNPTIRSAGQVYRGPIMSPSANTPSTSKVTNITWQWNIFNYNSSLITYLCETAQGRCIDVSGNFGAGANLEGANVSASTSWQFLFYMPGSGTLSPTMYGQNGSVAITYQ